MTGPDQVAPEIQAAISSLYQQGYEAGRIKGFEEGVEAARKHLIGVLSSAKLVSSSDPKVQEATASLKLDTAIEQLDLTVRTYNCLKRAGLHTIGQVLELTVAQLSQLYGLTSAKSIDEIVDKLAAVGYTIR